MPSTKKISRTTFTTKSSASRTPAASSQKRANPANGEDTPKNAARSVEPPLPTPRLARTTFAFEQEKAMAALAAESRQPRPEPAEVASSRHGWPCSTTPPPPTPGPKQEGTTSHKFVPKFTEPPPPTPGPHQAMFRF